MTNIRSQISFQGKDPEQGKKTSYLCLTDGLITIEDGYTGTSYFTCPLSDVTSFSTYDDTFVLHTQNDNIVVEFAPVDFGPASTVEKLGLLGALHKFVTGIFSVEEFKDSHILSWQNLMSENNIPREKFRN